VQVSKLITDLQDRHFVQQALGQDGFPIRPCQLLSAGTGRPDDGPPAPIGYQVPGESAILMQRILTEWVSRGRKVAKIPETDYDSLWLKRLVNFPTATTTKKSDRL